ncbi:iron chaperone [Pseudolysinimonas sp.]|uniref:iron chaperone n=1 Tax=Pseudolysinimonas sp. TaxID=2680009 RepID=UPI003F7D57C4
MTERGSAEAGPLSAYLTTLEPPVRAVLGDIAERARELSPDLVEGVSYAMPALLYRGRALVAVRETAKHLALYPYSGRVVAAVAPELERLGVGFSSGAIRFSADRPLPPELVDRILLTRRDEIDAH